MLSDVYFWEESLYSDLIGFDSTANGAGAGDVQRFMLMLKDPSFHIQGLALEVGLLVNQLQADLGRKY